MGIEHREGFSPQRHRNTKGSARNMSKQRDKMISALKTIVFPTVRNIGFQGSFPHFRRERDGQIDLMMFQFSRWGGGFVVDLGYCPASGYTSLSGERHSPAKVRVNHLHYRQRLRLGSQPPEIADHWFYYEPDVASVYQDAALEVLSLLRSQADLFWRSHEPGFK